jgi:hypothetical protein
MHRTSNHRPSLNSRPHGWRETTAYTGHSTAYQLAGRQVVLSTGVTLQFITDQNAAVNGDVFDSVFGPMKFMLVAKGSVLTISMASETNLYADGYLELTFTTATSGTFYRMVYSRGTRGAGTKTTGTFTLQ